VLAPPYDRATTTMAGFAMCSRCADEYADPRDRRVHAQPVCCPDCGPQLWLETPGAAPLGGERALAQARRLLAGGAVVAVKGLGGYHLACDAGDDGVVRLLRERKNRGDKPFAVLVPDVEAARALCRVDDAAAAALAGHHRPILLLPRRGPASSAVAGAVAPGNPDLGLMLPPTALHQLLLGLPGDPPGPPALVLTSGNLSGEPLATDDDEARARLVGIADAWLGHDREIHVPCDDSVVRIVGGAELPVRRSRGYAPLPVPLPFEAPPALAVGGDLKNTFCVAEGRHAWLSAHLGDMDDLATQRALDRATAHLQELVGVCPDALVADRHPGYRSRRWAHDHAAGRPVSEVQHHHAHVASTMVEHAVAPGTPVVGFAFDGTGYGDDGAVWGGEVLVADYAAYKRVAHLRYVPLPGGDAGVANACRMALSHLTAAGLGWDPEIPAVAACSPTEVALLRRQLDTGFACTPTSSMGRLFDAVASLTGVRHRVGYEAQAAIELEGAARSAPRGSGEPYRFAVGGPEIDPAPVVAAVVRDVLSGTPTPVVARRFHEAVAELVLDVAREQRVRTSVATVTLSGGVFLNALLTELCESRLGADGFRVLRHHRVPPSDAGLALGQLAVHAHRPPPDDEAVRPPEREITCV
jgi:hydrogenase maturation protein HypF